MEYLGAVSVLPTLLVFVLAILSRRPIESLAIGALVGLGIVHGTGFISGFAETSLRVLTDRDVAWVILACGFMGSLIGLLIRTGATREAMHRTLPRMASAIFAVLPMGACSTPP